MQLLLHICCAPCMTACLESLRQEGFQVKGYFYNPNIQPYREYRRRRDTLKEFCRREGVAVEIAPGYNPEEHLQPALQDLNNRCKACYRLRLQATARRARELGIPAFSTTLLISPYQNHILLQKMGEETAEKEGVTFVYRDFRPLFARSREISLSQELYMQPYCGCLFSERERFYSKARKQKKQQHTPGE